MVPPNAKILNQTLDKFLSWSSQFKNSAFHLGSHPEYTKLIKQRLETIRKLFTNGSIDQHEAYELVEELTLDVRKQISIGKGKSINEIKF